MTTKTHETPSQRRHDEHVDTVVRWAKTEQGQSAIRAFCGEQHMVQPISLLEKLYAVAQA